MQNDRNLTGGPAFDASLANGARQGWDGCSPRFARVRVGSPANSLLPKPHLFLYGPRHLRREPMPPGTCKGLGAAAMGPP